MKDRKVINVVVHPDLHKEVKVAAALRYWSMAKLVDVALREFLLKYHPGDSNV